MVTQTQRRNRGDRVGIAMRPQVQPHNVGGAVHKQTRALIRRARWIYRDRDGLPVVEISLDLADVDRYARVVEGLSPQLAVEGTAGDHDNLAAQVYVTHEGSSGAGRRVRDGMRHRARPFPAGRTGPG